MIHESPKFGTRGRVLTARYYLLRLAFIIADIFFILPCIFLSFLSRFFPARRDIGLGPLPLINHIYHKKALEKFGYSAESFVETVWHITDDFDVRADKWFPGKLVACRPYFLFIWQIFSYRCLYIPFDGAALHRTPLLSRLEPYFLKIAGIPVVMIPYGADVHDLNLSGNLLFKHAMSADYPHQVRRSKEVRRQVERWLKSGAYIIGGCEWVDFLPGWDCLTLSHFTIELDEDFIPRSSDVSEDIDSFKVVHAPNHRAIKGTAHLISAVNRLKNEGVNIDLVLLERIDNSEVIKIIRDSDLIVDQLVMGWYAMFAIEGMMHGKPVICNLRQDLIELYEFSGLLKKDELPLINADFGSIYDVLKKYIGERDRLHEIGVRSRRFVERHHSLEAVGRIFHEVNKDLGIGGSRSLDI